MIRAVLALFLALALAACGQEAERTDLPAPNPALWQVTAPDGKPAGWLFGTIHALPEGAKWRTPAIDKAIVEQDTDKRNQMWGDVDKAVMEQAVIYPGVYAKAVLLRSKNADNVFVNEAFGYYDYTAMGVKQ